MRPLPLIAALALLAVLTLRRRTLARSTALAGTAIAALLAGYGFGLYTLPSLDDALTRLAPALGNWTYLLVSLLAYLEAAAFVGLLVPGELTVVLGGAVARAGHIAIEPLFFLVWFAAAAGDTTGYLFGRRLGREFLMRHGPRFRITPNDDRSRRGDLQRPWRQGHHPRPLHRRRARDHAVPRRHLAHPPAAVPGVRHPGGRRLGGLLPGRRLPRRRERATAPRRCRTRSGSRSQPRRPRACSWRARSSSFGARRAASACASRGSGSGRRSCRGTTPSARSEAVAATRAHRAALLS